VPSVDAHVEVLEQPHLPAAAAVRVVAGECDEVEVVEDRKRAGEIGNEDDGGLERSDEDRLESLVVRGDLGPELLDASLQLLAREVDLADPRIG
jgi:hypothetical protein